MDQASPFDRSSYVSQRLSTDWPRMAPEAKARVQRRLDQGCWCGAPTATLRKRNQATYVAVWLQCDGCGKGYGEPFKRADHWHWQSYPLWDEALAAGFSARQQAALEDLQRERVRAYRERARQCLEWCRTSPEWRVLARAVLERANFRCEACLVEMASTVHHLTYSQGKLPPAWQLRAVCKLCYERLHADKRGEDDEWTS
jgi:hypothetical protein